MKNEERVTATRAKLIDAAICSLAELGFHRTTFVEVSRRSELSRGAIHHHFDSIPDLMNAVVRDLGVRIREEVTTGLKQLPVENTCDAGIDFLWEQAHSPNQLALQQIRTAITTDQQLRETVSAEVVKVTQWLKDHALQALNAAPGVETLDTDVVSVVFAALSGAAAQDVAIGAPSEDPQRINFCTALKRMAKTSIRGSESRVATATHAPKSALSA